MPGPLTLFDSSATHRPVITIVTALAHGLEIVVAAMLWNMVEVRGRQNDIASGVGMRLVVQGRAALAVVGATLPDALAPPGCALKPDASTDRFPVFRIATAILRPNRHYRDFAMNRSRSRFLALMFDSGGLPRCQAEQNEQR